MTGLGEGRSLEEMKPRPFLLKEFQIRFRMFWTSSTFEYIKSHNLRNFTKCVKPDPRHSSHDYGGNAISEQGTWIWLA